MKKALTLADAIANLDPCKRFGAAWMAAFLGVVLIIAVAVWAATAL
jgi:hypothetical protein